MEPETRGPEAYLRPLRRRWWLILAITLLATTATYLYSDRQPDRFVATTQLFIGPSDVDEVITGEASSQGSDRQIQNQAALIASRQVAEEASRRLKGAVSADELQENITVTPFSGSDVVGLEAEAGTAEGSAQIANTYAAAFAAVRRRTVLRDIERARAQLSDQLEGAAPADRRVLRQRLRRLQVLAADPPANARQIDPARAPGRATSPKPRRNAAFAFALALLLGAMLAYALDRLDPRVRRLEELEELMEPLPLLAALPQVPKPGDRPEDVPADMLEAVRTLRANLVLAGHDRRVETLLVTSALPGEGKSTLVRALSLVLAQAGVNVAVLDLDLRRPALARLYGLGAGVGAADVLAELSPVSDALQPIGAVTARVPVGVGAGADGGNGVGTPGGLGGSLSVMTAGTRHLNPAALLEPRRVRPLLDAVAADHEVVLVDSAPLLSVGDSVPLLELVDGVILVSALGKARRDALARVREIAGRAPTGRILGVAANAVPGKELGQGYGYSYQE
jgi:capsular polysaccharide biosynthesis protein/Mrp family chromosome partitioning ATPase